MDGSVIIGTELDTKQLEKQLKDSEKELAKYEKEAEELLKQRSELDIDTKEAQMELDEVDKKIKEIKSEMSKMEMTPEKTEGAEYKIAGINLSKEEERRKEILNEIEIKYDNIDKKIRDNANSQQRIRQEMQKTNEALNMSGKVDNIVNGVDSIGKSIKNTVKNTIRWGLAIFGIRSAYMFLSQAMSTLSQYDEQMATNIQYIRYLLASTLKPVIEYLIQLTYKLLSYINYIAGAWFHVNLFANASTEAFQKQNKLLGGSVKKAKELEKTLTGFDEMNILQENGNVGSGGGGGGVNLPSIPSMEEERPWWLDWIAKHKDEIIAGILGIATALSLLKTKIKEIKALGIGIAVAGLVYAVEGLLGYLKEPTWQNFGKIITGIGVAIVGVGIAFLGLPAIVTGVVVAILGIIISNWEVIKQKLDEGIKWLEVKSKWVKDFLGKDIGEIYDNIVKILNLGIESVDRTFKSLRKMFDEFISMIKSIINGDWKEAWGHAKKIFEIWGNAIIDYLGGILDRMSLRFKNITLLIGYTIKNNFKAVINELLREVEAKLNSGITLLNGLRNVLNKIPGVNLGKISEVKLPRLAKGGIVNMPGKGIPVGSAIVGERGAEGVIPLTDSQQMALLGEAIGKYITINANITNTMNGRVISKELKKIQNDSDFAYNR